jgi:predicted metal-dependent enzyme (double-stranded beta helix superfamily)
MIAMKLDSLSTELQKLINDIANSPAMNNEVLGEILAGKKLSADIFRAFETYHHPANQSYGRKLIYDHGTFKILLMSWAPGDYTAIHNHGYTEWGCVCFFGDATHRMYAYQNGQLSLTQKDTFTDGFIAYVCGSLNHLMGNAGKSGFTTLHIYGSNTRSGDISQNAKIFLPEHGKIISTMGSAYLQPEQNVIIDQQSFACSNPELLEDYFSLVKPYYERNNHNSVIEKMEAILTA